MRRFLKLSLRFSESYRLHARRCCHSYDGGTYWNLGLEEMGDNWKDLQLILQQWTSSNDPNTTVT